MQDIEVWVDIQGFVGLYEISSLGKVRSCKTGRILRQCKGKAQRSAYLRVGLAYKGATKIAYIHRLVAIHFVERGIGKDCVNHIDGDKSNNSISNLEWCTFSENAIHAFRTGLRVNKIGKMRKRVRLTKSDIIRIRADYKNDRSISDLSKMYDSHEANIYRIITRRTWKHI